MFSGKSEELIRRVRRAVIARRAVQVFKPAIDIRYNSELVSSHDGDSFEARPVLVGEEILQLMAPDTTVVGIDEVQFFDHAIVGVVRKLVASGHRVICAGLDLDFRGEPFGPVPDNTTAAAHAPYASASVRKNMSTGARRSSSRFIGRTRRWPSAASSVRFGGMT